MGMPRTLAQQVNFNLNENDAESTRSISNTLKGKFRSKRLFTSAFVPKAIVSDEGEIMSIAVSDKDEIASVHTPEGEEEPQQFSLQNLMRKYQKKPEGISVEEKEDEGQAER